MTICIRTLLATAALVPVLSAPLATAAHAQAARPFDIPPGVMETALVTFANQGEVQLLYTADLVAGRRTPGVQGVLPVRDALARLLSDSGLVASESRSGVYVLRAQSGARAAVEPEQIEDVVVTGTLIRGQASGASPVVTLTADQMDRAGYGSAAEALSALPQNFAGTATPTTFLTASDVGGSNTTLSTGVNLRGLGTDATLVLVNGRRLAGTGNKGEFSDVSAIPGAAVERVDVLLDGASALYGSDAVGGVVNIVLRREFDGQESRLRVGTAQGGAEEVMASHLIGKRWDSGSALISYEYRDQGALSGSDRPYTATADLRPFGGTDYRGIFASPGNLVTFDPVAAGYVATHAIRPVAGGSAQGPGDFVAGQANLANRRQGADIIPEQKRQSGYARLRQDLTDRLEISTDLRFSQRDFAFTTLAPAEIIPVTIANPFFVSPTGAAFHQVAYNFINDLEPMQVKGSSRSVGATAGADLALPRDWSLTAYGAWAEERSHVTTPRLQFAYLYEALGVTRDNPATAYSPSRDGYFNPFGSGGNSQLLADLIGSGYSTTRQRSQVSSVNTVADGSLWTLPGGELKLAVGAQIRREEFDRSTETFVSSLTPGFTSIAPQKRDIAAVFAEARMPLVGPENARPGLRKLELSLAFRAEDYEDFGSTTNPKVGLVWSPAQDLTLRASWGTSFRAPSLNELNEAVLIGAASTFENGVEKLAIMRLGGNPDLQPETARTFTTGFDYGRPDSWRISLSVFDTRFEHRIGRPIAENIANALVDPNLAAFVTRVNPAVPADLAAINALITDPRFVPPGIYPANAYSAILDARWLNTGELHVRGLDFSVARSITLGADRFDLDVAGSWLLDYSRKLTPTATRDDLLDVVGYPVDLRLRAGLTWTRDAWSGRVGVNYVDGYHDPMGPKVDRWITSDLNLRWAPTSALGVEGLELSVNVRNLFDEAPPFYNSMTGDGYDAGQADPLGRVISLQISRRW